MYPQIFVKLLISEKKLLNGCGLDERRGFIKRRGLINSVKAIQYNTLVTGKLLQM